MKINISDMMDRWEGEVPKLEEVPAPEPDQDPRRDEPDQIASKEVDEIAPVPHPGQLAVIGEGVPLDAPGKQPMGKAALAKDCDPQQHGQPEQGQNPQEPGLFHVAPPSGFSRTHKNCEQFLCVLLLILPINSAPGPRRPRRPGPGRRSGLRRSGTPGSRW